MSDVIGDALKYAASLVERFGWEPISEDGPRLYTCAHLCVAAGKFAAARQLPAREVQALLEYRLCQVIGTPDLFGWEAEQGRTAADVAAALLTAASPTP